MLTLKNLAYTPSHSATQQGVLKHSCPNHQGTFSPQSGGNMDLIFVPKDFHRAQLGISHGAELVGVFFGGGVFLWPIGLG